MANYRKMARQQPQIGEFIRNRKWVFRGDVLVYQPDISCSAFSTDRAGFRHSTFRGERLSFAECQQRDRFGVVLGASNIFGFGVAGNENVLPSLLAERFGFPFANLGMPAGNSRNLYTLLMSIFARSAGRLGTVVHFSGGDYSTFCRSSLSDSIFGSPSPKGDAAKDSGESANPEKQLPGLLAFSSLWTSAIVQACRMYKVPVVLGHDSTFFDKAAATPVEEEFELGKPARQSQVRQFANHRKFGDAFYGRRRETADQLKVPLAGRGLTDAMTFVDEFHCDANGMLLLADAVGDALAPLLQATREPANAE